MVFALLVGGLSEGEADLWASDPASRPGDIGCGGSCRAATCAAAGNIFFADNGTDTAGRNTAGTPAVPGIAAEIGLPRALLPLIILACKVSRAGAG